MIAIPRVQVCSISRARRNGMRGTARKVIIRMIINIIHIIIDIIIN